MAAAAQSVRSMGGPCTISDPSFICFATCCCLAVWFCLLLLLRAAVPWSLCMVTFCFASYMGKLRLDMQYVLENPSAQCVLSPASQVLGVMCVCFAPLWLCVVVHRLEWGLHLCCFKVQLAGRMKTTLAVSHVPVEKFMPLALPKSFRQSENA